MIEGLHFDIEFEEMREHLRAKARHHDGRRVFYERQVKQLQDGGAEAMQYSGGDPIKALGDKANSHEGRSVFFQFLADHLIEGETYRLKEADLRTLEFVSRASW